MEKPQEYLLDYAHGEAQHNQTVPNLDSLTYTDEKCIASCITGMGGEDVEYTCVGVARVFPGVQGTVD